MSIHFSSYHRFKGAFFLGGELLVYGFIPFFSIAALYFWTTCPERYAEGHLLFASRFTCNLILSYNFWSVGVAIYICLRINSLNQWKSNNNIFEVIRPHLDPRGIFQDRKFLLELLSFNAEFLCTFCRKARNRHIKQVFVRSL